MSSVLAEMHEVRDYMGKLDAWSKRINSRLVMAERRGTEQPSSAPDAGDLKSQLRRRAGLVPGRPAPHSG